MVARHIRYRGVPHLAERCGTLFLSREDGFCRGGMERKNPGLLCLGLNADVLPWGIEPQPEEPESTILSIKLWERCEGKVTKKSVTS